MELHLHRTCGFLRRYFIHNIMRHPTRIDPMIHRITKFCTKKEGTSVETGSGKQEKTVMVDLDKQPKMMNLTKHLQLHKAGPKKSIVQPADKPLVVLFQWLYAKPKAVKKYRELYHGIGLDVLTVRGKLSQFLWPPKGMKLSMELFDYIKAERPAEEKFIVHAFSLGAYNYTIAMKAAMELQEDSLHFRQRIIAQIFDSIVLGTYENMCLGIGGIMPQNKTFQKLMMHTMEVYYNTTQHITKDQYNSLVLHFKQHPIQVPTLLIYSDNDPMCDTATMHQMLSEWKEKFPDFDVWEVSWPESKHTAHMKMHQEDYLAAWRKLMLKLKLVEP